MRVTADVMASVPLPAAWVDGGGAVVAATPEWAGLGLGMREYRAGVRLRLLVSPAAVERGIGALTRRLLDELEAAVAETPPPQRCGLRLAATALGVVAGRGDATVVMTSEVAEAVRGACALENDAPAVVVGEAGPEPVAGGWLVAAALKQLVMNARKHEGCEAVRLRLRDGWFSVSWAAAGVRRLHGVATSRRRDRRSGWGLGVVRLCSDAVGASYLGPRDTGDGMVEAAFVLEPESSCLRLPLAVIDGDDRVTQATRTWDAESGVVPGRVVTEAGVVDALRAARAAPGRIAQGGAWSARACICGVCVALRPPDTREQGLDLLDGIAHEAELLVGGPSSAAWLRAVAVLEALRLALGLPSAAYGADEFRRDVVRYGRAFGADLSQVSVGSASAPPPALTAFLLASGGGELRREDGAWVVRLRDTGADELAGLVAPDGSSVRIGAVEDETVVNEFLQEVAE
jgi:hypothetical protein